MTYIFRAWREEEKSRKSRRVFKAEFLYDVAFSFKSLRKKAKGRKSCGALKSGDKYSVPSSL